MLDTARLSLRTLVQASVHPDSTNSFQFSLNRSRRALEFTGYFYIGGPIELKQYDFLHRFISERREQLVATL